MNTSRFSPELRHWVTRCLVALLSSNAQTVRHEALAALENYERNYKNNAVFKVHDGLTGADIATVKQALEMEPSANPAEFVKNIHAIMGD